MSYITKHQRDIYKTNDYGLCLQVHLYKMMDNIDKY